MTSPMPDLQSVILEQLELFEQGAKGAKGRLVQAIASASFQSAGTITLSSAKGGTKQLRNRLGQAEVRKSTQLTIFVIDESDNLEACVGFLMDAAKGRNDAQPPAGPVAFAVRSSTGFTVPVIVAARPTRASQLLASVFGAGVADPRESIKPIIPSEVPLWLLVSSGSSEYFDIDGIRYQFPTRIPNGQNVKPGDLVAVARTKGSRSPDAGSVFGIGRVGRRVATADGTAAYTYFDRFLHVEPALSLDELGDPRRNVNSIVALEKKWFLSLMRALTIERIEDLPVPLTALSVGAVEAEMRARDLLFPDGLSTRIVAALRSGKHLMFTGAPGTGKTSLALAVAAAASRAELCNEPMLTTGTADWTSADTVGAYRLTQAQELQFHPGHVVVAIEDERWLVIDELNRADIDKAIGQLFTALSGQAVVLPFDEKQDVGHVPISIVPPGATVPPGTSARVIPQNWRLLATLNDRDRDLLFDMSEALMRRFAVVEVTPPSTSLWKQILQASGGTGRSAWDTALENVLAAPPLRSRPLGAAVLLDCVHHLRQLALLDDEQGTKVDEVLALQEAFDLYLKPQLRTLAGQFSLDAKALLFPASIDAETRTADLPTA